MRIPDPGVDCGRNMERRLLRNLIDHNDDLGAFATRWEGWVDVSTKFIDKRARINVTHPDDIDRIADERGIYAVMYQPSRESRYVAYVGYSKKLSTELKIRYGGWEKRDRFMAARSHYPFAASTSPARPTLGSTKTA